MMRRGSSIKFAIVFAVLAAVFVLLNLAGPAGAVRDFFYSVSSPMQKNLWAAGAGVSGFFSGVFNGENLARENENLKLKIGELEARIAVLEEFEEENRELREALGIKLEDEFDLVFANITGKDVSGDFIFVDKGAKDGLSAGMPVVTGQKVLVGKLNEVFDRFSRITLITSKNFSFDAKISGTNIFGVAKGKGNFEMALELVPRDAELKKGDLVSTAALGGVFPPGILAGTIKSVDRSAVESFQTAEIGISWRLNSLGDLFIITNF